MMQTSLLLAGFRQVTGLFASQLHARRRLDLRYACLMVGSPAHASAHSRGFTPRITAFAAALVVLALSLSAIGIAAVPASASGSFTWGTPQDLGGPATQTDSPQIVSADAGTKLAATWVANDGSNARTYVSTSSDAGTTWQAPTVLSDPSSSASYPQIASSVDGSRLVVVWSRPDGPDYYVESAASDDGGVTWSTAQPISAPGADLAQVVASTHGLKMTAVWTRNNGSNSLVQSSTSDDGGFTWGAVSTLSASGQDGNGPQIAGSADGTKLTAAWYRSDGTNIFVQTRTSTDSGATWLPVQTISTPGGDGIEPQIVASNDGEKLATTFVWNGTGEGRIEESTSSDAGLTWSTPTQLSTAGQGAQNPRIAGSADGTKLVTVWSRYNGSNNEIQVARSLNSGASWSASSRISAPSSDSSLPRISADDSASTVGVTWETYADSTYSIRSAISSDSAASWSTPVTLSNTAGSSDRSQIAAAADGSKFAAVWYHFADPNAVIQTVNAIGTPAPAPDPAKLTPAAANGCVTPGIPTSIPRRGTKQLMKPGCTTTSGQRIGVSVSAKLRGDVRGYSLFCKRANKQPTATKRLANGTRYCASGALKIRTYGQKLTLRITWKAPETATYNAYQKSRGYRT